MVLVQQFARLNQAPWRLQHILPRDGQDDSYPDLLLYCCFEQWEQWYCVTATLQNVDERPNIEDENYRLRSS